MQKNKNKNKNSITIFLLFLKNTIKFPKKKTVDFFSPNLDFDFNLVAFKKN